MAAVFRPSLPRRRLNDAIAKGGNSDAAHQCQQGGYESLYRTDGTGFSNTDECVSYAAHGGVLATRVTVSFTDVFFSACNALTWGYELDGVQHDVANKAYGCEANVPAADLTVTRLSTQTLRVYLRDDTCNNWTFFENGNHAAVTGDNPYQIQIMDGGGFCEFSPDAARAPAGLGNFNATETLN